MEIRVLNKIENFCKQNYDPETYEHVHRVASYAVDNPVVFQLSFELHDMIYTAALLHDIIEDNPCDDIREHAERLLWSVGKTYAPVVAKRILYRLTKTPQENYVDYIKRLHANEDSHAVKYDLLIAYIVKLADMKDHLMQKDTLTDKLKEKYWEALPYLL